MSDSEIKIELDEALTRAKDLMYFLSPFCDRIEIAGSIRRKVARVGDIEIVCIPKKVTEQNPENMFEEIPAVHPAFIQSVNAFPAVKGTACGKYTQRLLPEGVKLDLFMAVPENWGLIFMIRTGSWQFSRRMMMDCKKAGCFVEGGFLRSMYVKDKIIPCLEEKDFFTITKQEYIRPEARIF